MPSAIGYITRALQGALLLFAACQAAPLGLPAGAARLHVRNPARLALRLSAVDGDRLVPIGELGELAECTLELRPGAYVVHARTTAGELALPAPMFPGTLPPDATLRLAVAVPPELAPDRDFAYVPAGPALIGDTLLIGQEDERPARVVDVPAFWLAKHEVRNAEFAAFLTAMRDQVDEAWCAFDSRKFRCQRSADGAWSTDAPDLPVVTVSLAGARAYCAWRTRVTGIPHRLPREVEWEKAARGPESFVYAYGNAYRRAAANQESGTLREVARFAPNGHGLFDMTGNAFEWTDDVYPARGSAPGEFQVLRGGSFVLDGMYLRNSFRMRQRPDVRTDDIGFRVLREVTDTRAVVR